MFFDAAYSDEEALTASDPASGQTVSSLLLLSYAMTFHGTLPGVAYIYGAGTLRKFRAQGHMTRLLTSALREASERGDTFAALIPASESLSRYYERFGFSSVFYRIPERYTAIHQFEFSGTYTDISATSPSELYPAFESMMSQRPCAMQQTRAQFLTLMDDCRLSGHGFAAVSRKDGITEACAMAWGEPSEISDEIIVTELLADSTDAAHAAISILQQQFPQRPVTIMTQPADSCIGGHLIPQGMIRIVNAQNALAVIASAHPELNITIRLRDSLLPENEGIYIIKNGTLRVMDIDADIHCNLSVTPSTLASILFSSSQIGEIMGLPSCRPYLSLMLN